MKTKLNTVQNGKGDKPRPVDKNKYNKNWDKINWKKPKPITNQLESIQYNNLDVICQH